MTQHHPDLATRVSAMPVLVSYRGVMLFITAPYIFVLQPASGNVAERWTGLREHNSGPKR